MSRSFLWSTALDGSKTDRWIFDEMLGDDPIDERIDLDENPTPRGHDLVDDAVGAILLDSAASRKAWDTRGRATAEHLPDDPDRYFTAPAGSQLIDVAQLDTIRARPEGIARAAELMASAYNSGEGKRKPLDVERLPTGRYRVLDGNSTTAIAKRQGGPGSAHGSGMLARTARNWPRRLNPQVHNGAAMSLHVLTYREKLGFYLNRSEAAKKAWDTRGRAEKTDKPARKRSKLSLTDQSNLRPATKGDAARLKALVIPPAWTDVMIADDPDAPVQATGIDVKGRKQMRLSQAQSEANAAAKFDRVKQFTKELPAIRDAIRAGLESSDPAEREAATVLYLIDKTGFRPGGDGDTKAEKQAYGASTLQRQHVKIKGDEVKFRFTGKKGVEIEKVVRDATLAKLLEPRLASKELFDTDDKKMGAYLKRVSGADFKTKDFRTYHGTAVAIAQIKSMPRPTSEKAYKAAQKAVATAVAAHLGNTPTVALKSYIDPAAWTKWKK